MVLLVVWIPFPRHRGRPAAGPRGQQALRVGRFLGNPCLLIWLRQLCHQQDCTYSRRGYCGAPPGCAGRLSLSGSRLYRDDHRGRARKVSKEIRQQALYACPHHPVRGCHFRSGWDAQRVV